MARVKQVCVVGNPETDQLQVFPSHDSIKLPSSQGSIQMNITYGGDALRVLFCKRCGVLYVDAHQREFPAPQTNDDSPAKPS